VERTARSTAAQPISRESSGMVTSASGGFRVRRSESRSGSYAGPLLKKHNIADQNGRGDMSHPSSLQSWQRPQGPDRVEERLPVRKAARQPPPDLHDTLAKMTSVCQVQLSEPGDYRIVA
jgi:hypothetical protein